jgi:hypothetical protein
LSARVALHAPAPDASIREWRVEQRVAGLKTRFGEHAEIFFVTADGAGSPDVTCPRMSAEEAARPGAVDYNAYFWEVAPVAAEGRRDYRVSWTGRVLPVSGIPLDELECPNLPIHAFNRNGPRGHGDIDFYCFQYFPFGALFRLVGLGPIDAFGHRIVGDFRSFRERDPNHVLVACIGGSAVWGTCTLPEQTFPEQLGAKLTASLGDRGKRVTVLNFGVPGAVVFGEMQRFLLFVADLKPEFVILHDGVNDLYYANTCDPWLVTTHAVAYPQNFEIWAKVLHQGDREVQANLGGPIAAPSDVAPLATARAYLRRKREAVKVAKAFGGKVFSGLQPFARSKSALSTLETARIKENIGDPANYRSEFDLVENMYNLMTDQRSTTGADVEINFHQIFRTFGAEKAHFCDMVHLDVDGEEVIAQHYCDAILKAM